MHSHLLTCFWFDQPDWKDCFTEAIKVRHITSKVMKPQNQNTNGPQMFLLQFNYTLVQYSPILIVPHKYIIIDCKPCPADLRENPHHTIALHIWSTLVKVCQLMWRNSCTNYPADIQNKGVRYFVTLQFIIKNRQGTSGRIRLNCSTSSGGRGTLRTALSSGKFGTLMRPGACRG